MRILAVGERNSGVTYHRLALPLSTMQKEYCLITDVINEELLKEKQFDIVIINRFYQKESLIKIFQWKNKYGFKLILDIDDHWDLFPQHPAMVTYRKFNIPTLIKDYIKYSDAVTCTHNRLKLEIERYNKNVYIIPNALPFDKDQFTDVKVEHEKVNFLHTGSVTHLPDVKQLEGTMKRLAESKSFKEASRIVVCGWNDYNKFHWTQICDTLTAKKKLDHQVVNFLPVELYMNFYNEADVLIVPLLDNKFNRMKSNLKALEAGAKNIPVMTYKKDPYLDVPTCFFVEDWEKDMKRMAMSKQMREDFGRANGEYVRKHFDLFKVNEKRFAIYNEVLGR